MMSADDMDTNFLHNIKCEPELDIVCMSDATSNSSEPESQMQWPMASESPHNFDNNLVSMLEPEIDLNEPPVHLVIKKVRRTNDIPINNNANILNITQKEIPILNIPQQITPENPNVQKKPKRGTGQPKSNAQMMREYRRRRKEDPVKYAEYLQRERIRNAKRKRLKKNQNATFEEIQQRGTIIDTELCRKALSQNGVEMSIIPKETKPTEVPKSSKSSASGYTLDDLLNELADEGHNNGRISRTLNAIDPKLFNQNNAILSVKHQAPSLISTKMAPASNLPSASATPATTSRLRVRSDLTTTKEVKIVPNMLPLSICNTTQLNHFEQITRPPKIDVPIIYKKLTGSSSLNYKSSKKTIFVHKKQSSSPPPLLPLPGIKIEKFTHTTSKQIEIEPIEIKTEIVDLDYGDINAGDSNSTSQDDINLNLPFTSSPTSSTSSSFASTSGCGSSAAEKNRIRRANSKSTTTILGATPPVSRNSRAAAVKKSPGKPHFLDSFLEYVAEKVDERKVFDYLRPKNTNL